MTRQSRHPAKLRSFARAGLVAGLVAVLSGCGGNFNPFNRGGGADEAEPQQRIAATRTEEKRETIWDLFENKDDPNVTVGVNKYIWQASLEVLNFLPIPVLDGGHMVFLGYEGVRGRPPSERFVVVLHMIGFIFIIALMVFVFALDLEVIPRDL